MKKIICSIILLSINIFANKHQNPNGQPFTLNLSVGVIKPDGFGDSFPYIVVGEYVDGNTKISKEPETKGANYTFKATLPLSSLITLKYQMYYDYSIVFNYPDDNIPEYLKTKMNSLAVDLHLPIYKLWDKN